MNLFRNFPIQRKMLAMTLSICGVVLLVAIAIFLAFQVYNFRNNFERDNVTLAAIVADNCAGSMSFAEDGTANELLSYLKAKKTVLSATLVLPNKTIFAHFGLPEHAKTLADFPEEKSVFKGEHLLVTQPVIYKKDVLGKLYLRTDYKSTFSELLRFYSRVILGVLIVSIALAVVLSKSLGRTITSPILALASTAKSVGQKKDYSIRASVGSEGDEVGLLATSFNEMLSRIESQDAALNLSQQKMEALIHSIDGIVWERDSQTGQFTFVSRQSEEILGYKPDEWLQDSHFWERKILPQDSAKAVQTFRELSGKGEQYSFEYRMVSTDARTVWIRESGTVLIEKGKPVAVRGIFQDITEHKLAAEQLDKLNRQLIDTSRHAGMADVATGVLHNVGNVLNSVSVSANLLSEKLRASSVGHLHQATTMLTQQNGRIAEFLTNDPKGKLLPEFLCTVAEELICERKELMAEMASVGQHIEHIKEIVAMQQNYAKVSGVFENLSAADLVEDALRMNAAAFERHQINLERDFAPNTPKVCVDRHKVLQILINLLRNAKHAMEDVDGLERNMTIRIAQNEAGRVEICVKDNGIGISAENLKKVFNHGFTTKKDGHGFGLHSGANSAKEMGGSLRASSEGPGKGAEFTLELPTTNPTVQHGNPAQKS